MCYERIIWLAAWLGRVSDRPTIEDDCYRPACHRIDCGNRALLRQRPDTSDGARNKSTRTGIASSSTRLKQAKVRNFLEPHSWKRWMISSSVDVLFSPDTFVDIFLCFELALSVHVFWLLRSRQKFMKLVERPTNINKCEEAVYAIWRRRICWPL